MPVETRSGITAGGDTTANEIAEYLDKKFEEFKDKLVEEIRKEIINEVRSKLEVQDEKIMILESNVEMLQNHVSYLKDTQQKSAIATEDLEQYGRRLCLRIKDVQCKPNETSNEVLDIVREQIKSAELEVPDVVLDRAHRIGKKIETDDKGTVQDIIVRFTSFRYRTMFYRSRKKVKGNARVRLDLTKKRYKLLNDATNYIKAFDHVNYVYADINCHLKVRFMSKEEKFFTSLNELKEMVK